jgi:hypothetical protein
MGIDNQHHAGITPVLLNRDHLIGRTERERFTEKGDRRIRRRRPHVGAHHLGDGQFTDPAGRTANGFAAQMKTPGRKRVSENSRATIIEMMTATSTPAVSHRSPVA